MPDDNTLIALLIQRMDEISRDQKSLAEVLRQSELTASDSRRRMHERLDEQAVSLIDIGHRMKAVERSMEAEAPTWAEYRSLKAKAAGAGTLGRILWRTGGWLIGVAAALIALRHDIAEFLRWLVSR